MDNGFPDPDPGDPKRPDPTGSGFATLVYPKKWVLSPDLLPFSPVLSPTAPVRQPSIADWEVSAVGHVV